MSMLVWHCGIPCMSRLFLFMALRIPAAMASVTPPPGGMAQEAYREAVQPETIAERKAQIHKELTAYCALDTYAMVRLWQVFADRRDLNL